MAQFSADVWLGSNSGYQKITVNSNTVTGAKEQIQAMYGVEDLQIRNLYEDRRSNSSSSDSSGDDIMGWCIIGGLVFCLWLLIEYWYIIVPAVAVGLVFYLWEKFSD